MGKRRPKNEEHEGGSERWLLTYSDMITLLMAFFIMMYSMSVLNIAKFHEAAISIRSGFGGLVDGQGKSVLNASGQLGIKPSPIMGSSVGVPWKVVKEIHSMVKKEHFGRAVSMRIDERGLIVSLVTDKVLFARGQAELSPMAKRILGKIAGILRGVPNQIRIEGHTCDLPVSSRRYPSNWELSTSRATNVVRYLIEHKEIPTDRLSAAGYADSKPLLPNTSEVNRAMNRRVDIVILKSGVN